MSFHSACLGISYHNFSRQLIDRCAGNCLGFIIKVVGTTQHMLWQQPPIHIPKALEDVVQAELLEQKDAGRFEDTTSSYRGSLFAVAKKGSQKVRLVIDLQKLNAITIRDASLLPHIEDFAEGFIG